MSAVQQFILASEYDCQEADGIAQVVSSQLQTRETTLVAVVESLAEYINDENDSTRAKAIQFLVQVFENLPESFLSRQQIQVLCQFLCDRIEDNDALHGLDVLSHLPRFTAEMAIMTFRAIRAHFSDLQSQTQSKRFETISLVNRLIDQHRAALRSIGTESLIGIVDLFSGERDPRNLMVVFSIYRVIIAEWDISEHIETVFDSVFCYFPITFRPPPNDPYGISAQDLKHRLKDCISASELFAPYIFPQLIDKLDSNSTNAKRDVFDAMSACAVSYSSETLSTYAITIWEALKFEIFNVQEDELGELALATLQTIAKILKSSGETQPFLPSFIKSIASECNERFQEPQQKQAQPAASIVGNLGATSKFALSEFAKICIPPLVSLYNEASNFEARRAILEILSHLLVGASTIEDNDGSRLSPLSEFKENLFQIFSQALMSGGEDEISFRLAALRCLTISCKCTGFLDQSEAGMVVQYFDDIILKDASQSNAQLRDETIDSLSSLSKIVPRLVSDIAFPALLAHLPDEPKSSRAVFAVLDAIARLKLDRSLSATILRRLFNKAKTLMRITTSNSYLQAVLAAMHIVLSQQVLEDDPNLQFYFEQILGLAKDSIEQAKDTQIVSSSSPKTVIILGRLSCQIIRPMNADSQLAIMPKIFNLLHNAVDTSTDVDMILQKNLHMNARNFLTYVMAAFRREIVLPQNDVQLLAITDQCIAIAQMDIEPLARHNLLQQIAIIANKFLSATSIQDLDHRLWDTHSGLFAQNVLTKSSIRVGFWIIKALLHRETKIEGVLDRLLDQLSNETRGYDVGTAFQILLHPDEILKRENGAIMRPLASQKIFDLSLTKISARLSAAPATIKPNFLVALSGLVKFLNPDMIAPRAEILLPILLQAVDLPTPGVKEAAVQTLATLVKTSPVAVESHVPSLVTRLLVAAANYNDDMATVRFGALECLESFPNNIQGSVLLPYRKAALKGMLRALDDPRRHVRKKAVDCRSAWLSLDEVEEDD